MTEQSVKHHITVTQIISGDLWAGAEVQVYNLCKALHNSDEVAVTAVVFNPGILHDKLVELGIPVTLADEGSTGPMGIAKAIASHCRSQCTDIVHTHGFKENVLGIFGKELARVRYSVRTVHGNPEHKLSWKRPHKWLVNRLDIWLGRTRQQAVIAVSSQLELALQPLFPGQVQKIFNFVDVEKLREGLEPRRSLNLREIKLGIVGRLVPVKRVDLFIETIALLNREGLQCTGVIIGDGPLAQQLQALASELDIEGKVTFKGFVNPALPEIQKLDILLMCSDHEGLPMIILEAAALGIPIIAHAVGGIPEVLAHWEQSVTVSDQSTEAYAKAVTTSLNMFTTLESNNSPNCEFMERFSSTSNSQKYAGLYQSLMTR